MATEPEEIDFPLDAQPSTKGRAGASLAVPVLLGLFALLLLGQGFRGVSQRNDYEVFHWGAEMAWNRSEFLYKKPSTKSARHFLYPPTAALAMIPMAWLPAKVSGYAFNVLRLGALALVLWIVAEWARRESGGRLAPGVAEGATLAAVLLCSRYLLSEFKNGQVNIVLLAMALGGARMAFAEKKPLHWAGGALIGVAGAIKGAPLFLLGVPILYKRWRAVAGALLVVGALGAASVAWFGPQESAVHWDLWKARLNRGAAERWDQEEAVSLPEVVVSAAYQAGLYIPAEKVGRAWLVEAAVLAALYFAVRGGRKRDGRDVSPCWDAALAALAIVLLAPVARKAHVVFALPALQLFLMTAFRDGWGRASVRAKASAALLAALFLGGRALPLESLAPGLGGTNPAIALALVAAGALLAVAPLPGVSRPGDAPSQLP